MSPSSFSPLLHQALVLLDAREPLPLQNLIMHKTFSADDILVLYQRALHRVFEHPDANEEAHRDIRFAVEAVHVLNRALPKTYVQDVINRPVHYESSLLERIAGLPDPLAQSLIEPLMAAGADPLRPDSFMNALHTALSHSSFGVLTAMRRAGLKLNPEQSIRALEHTALYPVYGLRALVSVFDTDLNTTLSDGGSILHWIVRSTHIEEVLTKLQYCNDMGVYDRPNNQGMRALELAKYGGDPRVLAKMDTYFSQKERPVFRGTHPFVEAAERLKDMGTAHQDVAHYLIRCAKYGLCGENRIFSKTGYGVGAMAIELGDIELLRAAFMEGESINAKVPRGAGLLGYTALMYEHCKERRSVYSAMFRLLLQQPGIDWDAYDKDGMSVRMWVEYALMDKSECHIDEGVTRMLEASNRAKMMDLTRIYA